MLNSLIAEIGGVWEIMGRMMIENFDLQSEVLLIAEIGNNHEGKYDLAEKMVHLAAKTKAQAVKFQVFKTEHYVSKKDTARFNRLKSFELTEAQFEKLSKIARSEGLIFIATPFDLDSAKFLESIVAAYKIGSSENNFYPLLRCVAETGKPVIISSGLTDISEIKGSKSFIEKTWRERGVKQELAVLHCVTSYPVNPEEANVGALVQLRDELKCTVGYSDHTLGIDACIIAVALGARIIEKHFTIDKNYSEFRDHKLSADPEELAQLMEKVKQTTVLLGSGIKILQPGERANVSALRRSIVAKRDLKRGHVVSWEDLAWTRPSGGLAPGQEELIIGKTLSQEVHSGDPITLEAVS